MRADVVDKILLEEGTEGVLRLIINAYADGFKAGKISQREEFRGVWRKSNLS